MQKPLDDLVLQEAVAAFKQHGTKADAARALGMPTETFKARLKSAARRGLMGFDPVMEGFEVAGASTNTATGESWVRQEPACEHEFEMPEGQTLKRMSVLTDGDNRVRAKWHITQPAQNDPQQVVAWLKSAFDGYEPHAAPVPAPETPAHNLMTLVPCNDWHINMLTWEKEVGSNWDLKIAEDQIGDAIVQAIVRSPVVGKIIVLGGGDLVHADNKENRTAASGNPLDVDGRYQKGVEVAQRLMVLTVDTALAKAEQVVVRILPGNHDEITSAAITYFLKAWYRFEPRVVVDTDPGMFFWYRFGKTFIGATHGHTVKLKDMPMIMAARKAEDWGKSLYRYVHGFHVHHKELHGWEEQGVVAEAHQAPIPQDSWHYASGFLSGRSVQTITYDAELGEDGRTRKAVRDA